MMAMPERRLRADRLAQAKSVTLAKPRKRMSYKVKERWIWAVLFLAVVVAFLVFGGNA